jgi:GT2 family glycosyltransferase
VVDDGSKDDSIEKVTKAIDGARYLKLNENRGPAAARNAGAALAKNDVILFADSDVVFEGDTISRVRKRFDEDASTVALCGEYDLEPVVKTFSAKFKAVMARSWIPTGGRITVFVARLGAIRKKVFDELGGFDESIRTASTEEWEFGRRLIASGRSIAYDPSITVKHHFQSFAKQVKLFFHRSFMWFFVFRKYGKFDNTCTTPLLAAAQIVGFSSVIFLALSVWKAAFMVAAAAALVAYIFMNTRFFKLAFAQEGPLFCLASLPLLLILSCSIVLGTTWAAVRSLIRPARRYSDNLKEH